MVDTNTFLDGPVGDPERWGGTARDSSIAGIALATVGLIGLVGSVGAVGGVLVGLVWYRLGGVYAVATGHVVLGALTGDAMPSLAPLAVIECGLLVTLLATDIATRAWRTLGAFCIAGVGGVAVLLGTHAETGSLTLAALALVGSIGVVVYGLHRYEVVVATDGTASEGASPT